MPVRTGSHIFQSNTHKSIVSVHIGSHKTLRRFAPVHIFFSVPVHTVRKIIFFCRFTLSESLVQSNDKKYVGLNIGRNKFDQIECFFPTITPTAGQKRHQQGGGVSTPRPGIFLMQSLNIWRKWWHRKRGGCRWQRGEVRKSPKKTFQQFWKTFPVG